MNFFVCVVETSRTKLEETDDTPQPQRRLIKADINLGFCSSFEVQSSFCRYIPPPSQKKKNFHSVQKFITVCIKCDMCQIKNICN